MISDSERTMAILIRVKLLVIARRIRSDMLIVTEMIVEMVTSLFLSTAPNVGQPYMIAKNPKKRHGVNNCKTMVA